MNADTNYMARAVELAARGQGRVEPNPMVGCVIVRGGQVLGEGWHQRYGGPHAEVEALRAVGANAAGATLYVTLEPCCHYGKTPPCTDAILEAKIARVVVAQDDPFPEVRGQGIRRLLAAGIRVDVGLGQEAAREINAPYRTLIQARRPWVIAKWAMTLDGKIASRAGHSRWISNESSRQKVHQLRGRMDAIMVGRATAQTDDPRLTARPPGPRTATRIVVDSQASLSPDSRLVQSVSEAPVLVAVGPSADEARIGRLADAGCELFVSAAGDPNQRLRELVVELGRRRWTNLLVEGGGRLLGSFFDQGLVDEIHAFVSPKIVGGRDAPSPVEGTGREWIPAESTIFHPHIEVLGQDVYITGRFLDTSNDPSQTPD